MTQRDQDPETDPPDLHDTGSGLPEHFERLRVSDNAHARAYARVGDLGRARIKQAISRLYALHLPNGPDASVCTHTYSTAQLTRSGRKSPRPWFLLTLDPAIASPAQLLAALVPAVARRVPMIAVVRPRSRRSWPDALLAGLELCGVESVFAPSRGDFAALVRFFLETQGPGGVGCLGGSSFWSAVRDLCAPYGQAACHWFRCPEEIGLWAGPGAAWDTQALRFAHPDAAFAVFGGPFEDAQPRPGGWQALRQAQFQAVFAPVAPRGASVASHMADPAVGDMPCVAPVTEAEDRSLQAPLVLAPGMECFWDFPDVPAGLYERSSTVYTSD